jgi:hypothetical protein
LTVEDVVAAGFASARRFARGPVAVDVTATGKTRPALEIKHGDSSKDIMQRMGKAVTDAVLGKHNGCGTAAMRKLGMSRSAWCCRRQ